MYNDHMENISLSEFKAHCLELVKRVEDSGDPIQLTRHGKPAALIVPVPQPVRKKIVFGKFKDSAKVVGDIMAPLDEPWDETL
jgi:prevent-host-death family protein